MSRFFLGRGLYLKRSGEMCPVYPESASERFRYNPLPYLAFIRLTWSTLNITPVIWSLP